MAVIEETGVLIDRDGDEAHASLNGPVNRETVHLFEKRLERVTGSECRALVLDLGGAEHLDSDGVRWLQRLKASYDAEQIDLRLAVREGSRIERTLRLLQLDHAFSIEHTSGQTPGAGKQRRPSPGEPARVPTDTQA